MKDRPGIRTEGRKGYQGILRSLLTWSKCPSRESTVNRAVKQAPRSKRRSLGSYIRDSAGPRQYPHKTWRSRVQRARHDAMISWTREDLKEKVISEACLTLYADWQRSDGSRAEARRGTQRRRRTNSNSSGRAKGKMKKFFASERKVVRSLLRRLKRARIDTNQHRRSQRSRRDLVKLFRFFLRPSVNLFVTCSLALRTGFLVLAFSDICLKIQFPMRR
jgi:hypothetical protein